MKTIYDFNPTEEEVNKINPYLTKEQYLYAKNQIFSYYQKYNLNALFEL